LFTVGGKRRLLSREGNQHTSTINPCLEKCAEKERCVFEFILANVSLAGEKQTQIVANVRQSVTNNVELQLENFGSCSHKFW